MTSEQAKFYFDLEKKSLLNELELLEKYKVVNELLKLNDWFFVAPLFFQGIELDYLYTLSKKDSNRKQEITKLIYRKFYNLNWTASFIDGYCKRCSHIEPFLKSIEHSVILAFQRDYEGSIKTLIPIIEGILRKYLFLERKLELDEINFKTLKRSFDFLQKDLMDNFEKRWSSYSKQSNVEAPIYADEFNTLVGLKNEYYNGWFSFAKEFINESLYKKVNTPNDITNELNRHSILHEWGLDSQYNLENYLKIYFLLYFITWTFLIKENKSLLNKTSGFRYFEKIVSYEKIIKLSERLLYEKHLLLRGYDGYNPELLRETLPINANKIVSAKKLLVYKILKKIDKYLWKSKQSF